jgi:uncharacterized protein (DUF1778 family)
MLRKAARTPTPAKRSRGERLEARISKAQKDLFLRAAELQGRSLTDFLIASAQEAALEAVRTHESMRLSESDRRTFVSALLSPPAPTKALLRAARRYRQQTGR